MGSTKAFTFTWGSLFCCNRACNCKSGWLQLFSSQQLSITIANVVPKKARRNRNYVQNHVSHTCSFVASVIWVKFHESHISIVIQDVDLIFSWKFQIKGRLNLMSNLQQ